MLYVVSFGVLPILCLYVDGVLCLCLQVPSQSPSAFMSMMPCIFIYLCLSAGSSAASIFLFVWLLCRFSFSMCSICFTFVTVLCCRWKGEIVCMFVCYVCVFYRSLSQLLVSPTVYVCFILPQFVSAALPSLCLHVSGYLFPASPISEFACVPLLLSLLFCICVSACVLYACSVLQVL